MAPEEAPRKLLKLGWGTISNALHLKNLGEEIPPLTIPGSPERGKEKLRGCFGAAAGGVKGGIDSFSSVHPSGK